MPEEKPPSGNVLIAIHGVGAPKPGEILDELLSVPHSVIPMPLYTRADLASEGLTIPCAQATRATQFDTLVELNWTDVAKPLGGVIGVVRHLFLLVLAMLKAQPGRPGHEDAQTWTERAYRVCFETFFVWCIWPVVTTLLVNEAMARAGQGSSAQFLAVMCAASVTAVVAAVTRWFSNYSKAMRAGFMWALLCLVVGVLQVRTDLDAALITVAAQVYSSGQFVTIVFLAALGTHVVVAGVRRRRTLEQVTARIALGHAPLVMMSVAGAVIWAAALSITSMESRKTWTDPFLNGLRYDLQVVEHSATLVIAIVIPLAVLAVAGSYLLARRIGAAGGILVQHWLSVALLTVPLLLSIPGVLLMYGFIFAPPPVEGRADVVAVYAASALRVAPWAAMMLVTPLRVLFDVLGDVAFFVVPLGSPLSVRAATTSRLRKLLTHFQDRPVTVVAYSQGSLVALEELRATDGVTVVTVGSPIQSLYKRFLGFNVAPGTANRKWRWINLYRPGDYIGGAIDAADASNDLEKDGGHLGYFKDAEVWTVLMREADARKRGNGP